MASNGYLNTASLVPTVGGLFLERRAGRAFAAASKEMVRRGYSSLVITSPDGAYRTYARQVYWRAYWVARGLPGNAAVPGTSNHGWGTAVDIYNVAQYPRAVLVSVMASFGFSFTQAASEPWHVAHDGREIPDSAVAGSGGVPISNAPSRKGHPSMYLMHEQVSGSVYLITDGGVVGIRQPSHLALFTRVFNSYPNYDTFNATERDIIIGYINEAQNDNSRMTQIINALTAVDNANTQSLKADLNYLQVEGPYSFKAILEGVRGAKPVDTAPVVAAVVNALANVKVTVDPALIAKAVDTQLADNFAKVDTDAQTQTSAFLQAVTKIGTVDTKSVADAVAAAVKASGLALSPEVAGTIAGAVRAAIAPDLVRLELKNQIK
jgi:hypothetical protein